MAGNLPDYPAPPGSNNWCVATVAGPVLYAVISTGSPPTGGQTILASTFGLTNFNYVQGSASDDGQFGVRVIYPGNPQTGVPSVILQWFTLATGAEIGAVNVSANTVRLLMSGLS